MSFFFKKKQSDPQDSTESLSGSLQACEIKQEFLLDSVQTLLQLIKESYLDVEELDPDSFHDNIDNLSSLFSSGETPRKMESVLEKQKPVILSFLEQEKTYLGERETELKNIIDLLTKAVVTINAENADFNSRIFEQSEKMEEITHLDDIRKIKAALRREIEQMRMDVRKKQSADGKRVEALSKRVDTLKTELEKAQTTSLKDGLTGAYNRYAFDVYVRDFVDESSTPSPFSMLLLDIDNFKNINDTYGHQIGDRVLLALVQTCKNNLEQEHFLARFGGEEFAIVLPGVSLRKAVKRAEHLCKAIAGSRYTVTEKAEPLEISFTVSIGVSSHKKGDTIDTITERADKALYAAKDSGKNCVITEKQARA